MRIPTTRDRGGNNDESFMTPMIDVVFLLLIFFICASAAYVVEHQLPIPLASGASNSDKAKAAEQPLGNVWLKLIRETDDENRLTTTFLLNGRRYVDQKQLATVVRELAEVAPEMPVILDIDKTVPMQDVVDVYDLCRRARFHQIRFSLDPATVNKSP